MTSERKPRTLRRAIAAYATGTAIAALLALWAMTWRKETSQLKKLESHLARGEHLVAVFWHGKYFSLFALASGLKATVVTTRSYRGDVIARICRWFGYRPVQIEHGAETHALAHLEADLSRHDAILAAIAIDGPRGPAHYPKAGALRIASDMDFRLIPISVTGTPRHIVATRWDKHEIPLPFASVRVAVGEPFDLPPGLASKDMAKWQEELRDRLIALERAPSKIAP